MMYSSPAGVYIFMCQGFLALQRAEGGTHVNALPLIFFLNMLSALHVKTYKA